MASENKKLLTIAIPTYNRVEHLKRNLDSLCIQITEEIKVVVRDNCSTNYDFETFITPYCEKYGIEGIQNPVNIGGDANIARLFESCSTKWLLVVGDDDYLENGAVSRILAYLKEYPNEVIVKFNSVYIGETIGIDGFAKAMRIKFQFGYTYFISETVHNIEKTKIMMSDHYKYLTLFTAQILRVICYLMNTDCEKCLFVKDKILCYHSMDITWNRMDLVDRNLWLMFLFRKYRHIFRDNIFKEIVANSLIASSESSLPFKERFFYYKEIIRRFGIVNTIRYNFRQFAHVLVREIGGNRCVDFFKRFSITISKQPILTYCMKK